MFKHNDFSEQPRVHAAGVLPTRHPTEHRNLSYRDPALHVMTDFTTQIAITVEPERQIDAALKEMSRLGVRAMLVVRSCNVIGLITSYDIEGPRPRQFAERSQLTGRDHIRVVDIMTGWEDLPTLDWNTMKTTRISDLLEIFDGVGVRHLIVVDGEEVDMEVTVRGLISRSRIERDLNDRRSHTRLVPRLHRLDPG